MRRIVSLVLLVAFVATACAYETKDFEALFGEDFSVDDLQTAQSSRIYDRNGTLITELRGEQNRTDVPLTVIPDVMINAVVAIEDERFYDHQGVDLKAILRAARSNVSAGGIAEGGSTITQQYVGNVFLDRTDQTGSRKVEEIFMALRFEEQFSKDFILERYLNWVYFGNGAYGVEAAAREYFGSPSCERALTATDPDDRDCHKVSELTIEQAALIAGLIQRPGAFNPYDNPNDARTRRDLVLQRMLANEYITAEEYETAILQPIELVEEVPILEQQYPAAHFVEEVKQWFLDNEEFGETRDDRAALLFEGGLDIHTTIDLGLQAEAEAIVEADLPKIRADGSENPDAAVVVLGTTPVDDGHVLVMVGGRDFWGDDEDAKLNLAAGKGRQAGSSMKPIALAAALEQGIPITAIYPAPSFKVFREPAICGSTWRVRGGGGGQSTLREATRQSKNTVFAQLMIDITPAAFVEMSEQLGIGEDRIDPICAAVLGSEDVNMVEMATVYSTFARSGSRVDPTYVTSIANPNGTLLYRHTPEATTVLTRSNADTMTESLERVIESGTGRRAQLEGGRPAAGKTGTAQNNADATFLGYTPQRTAGVWVGFPEGQIPMRGLFNGGSVQGGTYPAVIWGDIMDLVHRDLPVVDFPDPPPSSTTTRARTSVLLPSEVAVPSLVGLTLAEANSAVSGSTLQLVPIEVETSAAPAGTIFNQAPAAGVSIPGGASVTVEVAVAPPDVSFVTVPGVTGSSAGAARQVLSSEGFGVSEEIAANPEGGVAPGVVWAQIPGAGQEVAYGSLVTIRVQPEGGGGGDGGGDGGGGDGDGDGGEGGDGGDGDG